MAVQLFIVLCLILLGGGAWLTRNPDAEILRRAQSWPWIGPAAAAFRHAYLPHGPSSATIVVANKEPGLSKGATAAESEPPPPPRAVRQQVWILAGLELKAGPSAAAATLYRFDKLARAGKIERQGDWYRVDYHGRSGWVLLEGYDENAAIPYGETPELPLPVPSRVPDEAGLAAARSYLRGHERVLTLGPHVLYTDCRDDGLIALLDAVAGGVEAAYVERYGRRPIGDAAEAVVLFQSDIAYRLVQRRTERLEGLSPVGHNSEGIAMLYVAGRSPAEVAGTVVHELTHLLNRRALGPQLPPWLDEGLATDLASSRIDPDGGLHPGELSGARLKRGGEMRLTGGQASLLLLSDASHRGELPAVPDLIGADWDSFVRSPDIELHYAVAAFWIRFLNAVDGGRHATSWRAFLAAVAAGEPATAETLQAQLGESWSTLDAGFREWIEERAASLELPAGS